MDFTVSPRIAELRDRIAAFVARQVLPLEEDPAAWDAHENIALPVLDELRAKARAEGLFLQQKLRQNRYNVSKTAETLGMQRSNLYKKITKYGLRTQPEDPGGPSSGTG